GGPGTYEHTGPAAEAEGERVVEAEWCRLVGRSRRSVVHRAEDHVKAFDEGQHGAPKGVPLSEQSLDVHLQPSCESPVALGDRPRVKEAVWTGLFHCGTSLPQRVRRLTQAGCDLRCRLR